MKFRFIALLLVLVTLSGCIDVVQEQTLNSDGTYDIRVSYEFSPEMMQMANSMPSQINGTNATGAEEPDMGAQLADNITIPPELESRAQINELENGVEVIVQGISFEETFEEIDDDMLGISNPGAIITQEGLLSTKYTFTREAEPTALNDPSMQMFASSMSLEYIVNTFAPISETTGELVDDNTARFDLITHEGPIIVEFEEKLIPSWILYAAAGLIAIILISIIIVKMRHRPAKVPQSPIEKYVKQARKQGANDQTIREQLNAAGWDSEMIEKAMKR